MNAELVQEYKTKIQPILPLAKKAFGSRNQETPAHDASREYTRLLIEFHKRGGSLPQLAKARLLMQVFVVELLWMMLQLLASNQKFVQARKM